MLPEEAYRTYRAKQALIEAGITLLETTPIRPNHSINDLLVKMGSTALKKKSSLADLLRRPELSVDALALLSAQAGHHELQALIDSEFKEEIQLQVKFKGYIERQDEQVARFRKIESITIPKRFDYTKMSGLSNEVIEKLSAIQPRSLGQASRISGITPAAVSILQVHLRKMHLQNKTVSPSPGS